jgi:outer membrane protein assembly factor BamB
MRFLSARSRPFALLLALALFAGCGGRSGLSVDGADAPPTPEPPPPICAPASGSDTWNLALGSSPFDLPIVVKIAENGDLVLAVVFLGTIDFGCETYSTVGDTPDLLLARLDPRGRLLWAHHLEQTGYVPRALDMAIDGAGNIVVTGDGAGTPSSFGGATLTEGMFLLSFDPAGALRWAHDLSGAPVQQVYGWSLGVSSEGRVLLVGGLRGTIDIGLGPIVGDDAEAGVAIVAAWDQDGTPRFGHTLPFDATTSIAVGADGAAVLVGLAGTGPFNGPSYPVIAKLSADGALLWQQSFMQGYSVVSPGSLDALGNLVIEATSDGGTPVQILSGLSGVDGHLLWTRALTDTLAACTIARIVPLPGGRILTAGGLFGTVAGDVSPVTEAGSGSACLMTLDAPGTGGHLRRFGDSSSQRFDGVALDPTAHPIVTGWAASDFDLGASGVVVAHCEKSISCRQHFVARLAP